MSFRDSKKSNTIRIVRNAMCALVLSVLAVLFIPQINAGISGGIVKNASATQYAIEIDSPYMFNNSSEIIQGDMGNFALTDPWIGEIINAGFLMNYEYASDNPDVVYIDASGTFRALSQGVANISIKVSKYTDNIQYENDYEKQLDIENNTRTYDYTFYVSADASAAVPDATDITLYSTGKSVQVHLSGIPVLQYYKFDYQWDDKLNVSCSFDSATNTLTFEGYKASKGNVTITLNNATIVIHVTVIEVGINKDNLLVTPKTKKTLKIKNYDKSKITWKSMDPKIAKVSSSGVVTAKKTGNTIVYATLDDGEQFGCAVCVVTPTMKKVVDRAKMIGSKWTYSQPKRMQKGYYDCSSLVWQCYKLAGKNFGARYYAPVAADILRWCVRNKKTLKKSVRKKIYEMSLRPGDMTFRTGQKNGRYKGTYHVEMFVGYKCVYMSNGKYTVSTMWAARGDDYPPDEKYIARP